MSDLVSLKFQLMKDTKKTEMNIGKIKLIGGGAQWGNIQIRDYF